MSMMTTTTTMSFVTETSANDQISIESTGPADAGVLDFHRGAIDQTTITTRPPGTVMKQVNAILLDMGVEIQKESRYRYRCVRPQKGVAHSITTGALGAQTAKAASPLRMGSPDFMDSPTVSGDAISVARG